jgi:hypothetical protein
LTGLGLFFRFDFQDKLDMPCCPVSVRREVGGVFDLPGNRVFCGAGSNHRIMLITLAEVQL